MNAVPVRCPAIEHPDVPPIDPADLDPLLARLAAVPEDTRLEYVGLGPGVPRRVKRELAPRLRPAASVHPDLRAIASVYR